MDMNMEEFNAAAETYDGFAQYDREGAVALVGHLVMHLIEAGLVDAGAFLDRIDRDIAEKPDTDDQISRRLIELKAFLER